jgi:hypothetical protein
VPEPTNYVLILSALVLAKYLAARGMVTEFGKEPGGQSSLFFAYLTCKLHLARHKRKNLQ